MTEIEPFAAVIYNYENRACQPQKVICPPYDIITTIEANRYRRLCRYNMIHLTLPKAKAAFGRNQYKTAASYFNNWLQRQILCQDKEPAIYFYQQEYKVNNRRSRRLGFIACLSLNSSSQIYGHEHTRIEPKEDRFKLLVNVQANLEPIFVLFSDPQGFIQDIYNKYVLPQRPLIRFHDRDKNMNVLWRLTKPAALKKIKMQMMDKIIFIADGHHRYEVSLHYRALMRKRLNRSLQGNGGFNYIMAYFCPIQSPELVIRPVHRLVKGIEGFPMEEFKKFFSIHKTTKGELFRLLQTRTPQKRVFGLYFNKNFYILVLRNRQILSSIDKDYRRLDISLLNYLALRKLLKVQPEDKRRVIFSANSTDLIRQADRNNKSLVFFVHPVKIRDIIYLAKKGKKMPAKTTYFFPKVPSGLVIYKFSN